MVFNNDFEPSPSLALFPMLLLVKSAPKSRAPDPFDGTREKYSTFVLQLSLLFQNDPARYGSEGIQIRTAASYLTGGALGWFKAYHDEITQQISFFKKGANNDLQIALAHQLNPPNNFDKYVAMCIQLDNNIRNLKGQGTHCYSHPSQNLIVSSSPSVPASTSSGTAPRPMDLSALNRSQKRGPIDEVEKKRRRDNNLSIYCGQSGH